MTPNHATCYAMTASSVIGCALALSNPHSKSTAPSGGQSARLNSLSEQVKRGDALSTMPMMVSPSVTEVRSSNPNLPYDDTVSQPTKPNQTKPNQTKPNRTMSKDKTKTKQTPCCPNCKSTTDLTFDASGYWNMNTQSVEFDFVSMYCNHCYHSGDYELVPANNQTK